jgi:hypothetical protein
MTTPGFDVLPYTGGAPASGPGSTIPRSAASGIVPQTYPAQCQGAQGYSKQSCYGVVQMCQDCCQHWNPGQGYVEVCGSSYVCGACFGFDW